MKFHFSRKQLCIPYALFLVLFVILPMLFILYYAFTDSETGMITLNNFIDFFSDDVKLSTLLMSLAVALITTAACILIAYPVAYILARSHIKKSFVLLMLFVVPMWINFVLRVNALRELLGAIGLLGKTNFLNTIIGMVYDFLPFMILPLYTTILNLNQDYLDAASDAGANKLKVFTKVTLPLSMPGIVSGITMVFLPSMTNYIVSDILGNSKVTIIGKLIEQYFGVNWNMGSMISIILLFIIMISMLLTGGFSDDTTNNARGSNLW